MPSSNPNVVLLPTYNECENLARIVPDILAAAPTDICIIDDNSPDGTGAIADLLAQQDSRVQVLHRTSKDGLGQAYLAGFSWALARDYNRIIEMDADFSHPPRFLPKLIKLADEHDLVLGSRWVKGGGTENWPLRRRLISRCGSLYARLWLGCRIRDFTGGFKCFRREVLAAIDFADIRTSGYAFQIEMTYRAIRRGFSVIETPIIFVERQSGVSKMSRHVLSEAIFAVPRLRFEVK